MEEKNIQGTEAQQPEQMPAAEPQQEATQLRETEQQQNIEQPQAPEQQPTEPQAPEQGGPHAPRVAVRPSRSGSVFLKMFLASLLALVAFAVIKIFFWGAIIAALFAEQPIEVPQNAILKIDLQQSISDAPLRNPMGSFDIATMSFSSPMTLLDALTAIDAARDDSRIKALYINTSGIPSTSITIMEELREAIMTFRQSGKPVVAYSETYDQWSYYLASAADEVFIHPEGSFTWTGLSLNTMFYTGLIEKLGIGIDILRPTVCRYKSAVEPFFLKSLSDANREQLQCLADDMWNTMTVAIGNSRDIEPAKLNEYADKLAVVLPAEAVELKMVDGVKYADQMDAYFQAKLGVTAEDAMISLATYAQTVALKNDNPQAQVAIIYANGNVVDGNGTEDAVYGEALSQLLKQAREDEAIKAVVLRVNSPGGSALASDLIWREMTLLQQTKPVVVSMGEYAASGGYYISAPADAIVANRMTLTGSIGVFGIMPNIGKALEDNLGITFDGVKTNTSGDFGQGIKPLSDSGHKAMMRSVDRVYERFTSLVAEGRNLAIEEVYDIAEGRVWSGQRATEIGLVDMVGGLYTAIGYAVNVAGLGTSYQIVELTDSDAALSTFMSSLSADVEQSLYNSLPVAEAVEELREVQQMLTEGGVYTFCPLNIEIK